MLSNGTILPTNQSYTMMRIIYGISLEVLNGHPEKRIEDRN
jgi:hypothetical protein